MTVAQRRRFVYEKKLCFKCFRSHAAAQCSKSNCSVCGQPHNILMHFDKNYSGNKRVSHYPDCARGSSSHVQQKETNGSLETENRSNHVINSNKNENLSLLAKIVTTFYWPRSLSIFLTNKASLFKQRVSGIFNYLLNNYWEVDKPSVFGYCRHWQQSTLKLNQKLNLNLNSNYWNRFHIFFQNELHHSK